MRLSEKHNSIRSRKDFVVFVRALRQDLLDNPQSWENSTPEPFLEAIGGWVEDMDGYYVSQQRPVPQEPDWKLVGDMLMAARVYE
jgi:hypothetical protein